MLRVFIINGCWVLSNAFSASVEITIWFYFFNLLKRFYLFLERDEGRDKEKERNINVWLPLTYPLQGTWPVTQPCALTGNWTGDLLVHRLALSPLSHMSQGWNNHMLLILGFVDVINHFFCGCWATLASLLQSKAGPKLDPHAQIHL